VEEGGVRAGRPTPPSSLSLPPYVVFAMADDPNSIPTARFARWILLGVLVAGGVVLYFRNGTRVAPFGSAPATTADSGR
jgi:hypothetical protein